MDDPAPYLIWVSFIAVCVSLALWRALCGM